jgi:hypothetical protein
VLAQIQQPSVAWYCLEYCLETLLADHPVNRHNDHIELKVGTLVEAVLVADLCRLMAPV